MIITDSPFVMLYLWLAGAHRGAPLQNGLVYIVGKGLALSVIIPIDVDFGTTRRLFSCRGGNPFGLRPFPLVGE